MPEDMNSYHEMADRDANSEEAYELETVAREEAWDAYRSEAYDEYADLRREDMYSDMMRERVYTMREGA